MASDPRDRSEVDRPDRPNRPGRPRSSGTPRDRGQSTVLGFVLMLTIASILVSGLLIGMGGLVDGERERAVRAELSVIGEQLAGDFTTADNLVQSTEASPGTVEVTHEFPSDVTGSSYTIAVETSPDRLVLSSAAPEVTVVVGLVVDTSLTTSSVSGGEVRVVYTGSALEVRDA